MQLLLNIGGPDRVSRAQMAEAVAHIRGYNNSLITPVSASTVRISFSFSFSMFSFSPAYEFDYSLSLSLSLNQSQLVSCTFSDNS